MSDFQIKCSAASSLSCGIDLPEDGPTGATGAQGDKGDTGPGGDQGPQGPQGLVNVRFGSNSINSSVGSITINLSSSVPNTNYVVSTMITSSGGGTTSEPAFYPKGNEGGTPQNAHPIVLMAHSKTVNSFKVTVYDSYDTGKNTTHAAVNFDWILQY